MSEEIEKVDSGKDNKVQKNNYHGDPLFNTIDRTPYRGYGFSEVSIFPLTKIIIDSNKTTKPYIKYLTKIYNFHSGPKPLD